MYSTTCHNSINAHFVFQVLFRHVLSGEIGVDRLVRMTPEQLASPELATWREQETKHVSTPYFCNFRGSCVEITV